MRQFHLVDRLFQTHTPRAKSQSMPGLSTGALLIPIPWPDERVGGLANVSTASPLRQLPPAADMPSQMPTAAGREHMQQI
jgi:hypothetical protein